MTLCPRCGTANRIGARFCRVCRTELPATVCPHCGEPLRSGARFCRRCGQPVPEASRAAAPEACPRCGRTVRAGARFCPGCGASLSEAVAVSCPHCRTPLRPGARFCARCGTPVAAPAVPPSRICPRCGAPARPSARFCGRCSQPLAVPSPVSPPPSPSAAPILPGTDGLLPLTTLAGRYVILEKVGEGGMAIVYKAQDKKGNQIVAIKEMSESVIRQKNPDEWKRILEAFEREARFLATLSHPNLVRVSDAFREGERRYMVMEFVAGRTLEAMLEEQLEPFPEDRVLVWAAQLCDVLAYLHSQTPKIIYRDLKPGNVMVLEETDQVKLLDMGIARTYKPGKQQDTIHLGTPGYAPPEQYGKGQTDERSDVYALGALLHHLLSLRDPAQKPFDFPPLQTLNPKVSQRVADAVARAVEKERSKRFPSVQEMKAALLGEEETVLKPAKPRAKKKPAPPAKKPPPLKILPPELDWNVVVRGTPAPPMSLTVLHPAGAKVTATSPVPWLEAEVVPVDDETTEVTVRLNTSLLPLGQRSSSNEGCLQSWISWHIALLVPESRHLTESLTIELDDGRSEKVPVTLTVAPSRSRVQLGWFAVAVLLLIEISLALFCVAVLLSGSCGSRPAPTALPGF